MFARSCRSHRGATAVLLLLVQLLGSGSLSLAHAWDLGRASSSVVADPAVPTPPFHEHTDCHACKVAGLHALAAGEPSALADFTGRTDSAAQSPRQAPVRAQPSGGGGPRAPPA